MADSRLTILGCGSAKPTKTTSPSGQLVDLHDKRFLVDCGEGVLLTMQRLGIRTGRLYSIFISHLHGDHCFGLIGLLTTLSMLKRTQPMHIYAQPDLQKLLQPLLDYHCADRQYDIVFHPINPRKHEVIYQDRTVSVETIPLKHGVPTCGFLFCETRRVKNVTPLEYRFWSVVSSIITKLAAFWNCCMSPSMLSGPEQKTGLKPLFTQSLF